LGFDSLTINCYDTRTVAIITTLISACGGAFNPDTLFAAYDITCSAGFREHTSDGITFASTRRNNDLITILIDGATETASGSFITTFSVSALIATI
jgi:hypothetical protein